jgi:hypothetical protein
MSVNPVVFLHIVSASRGFARVWLTTFPALALGTVFVQGMARRRNQMWQQQETSSSFLKPIFKNLSYG